MVTKENNILYLFSEKQAAADASEKGRVPFPKAD